MSPFLFQFLSVPVPVRFLPGFCPVPCRISALAADTDLFYHDFARPKSYFTYFSSFSTIFFMQPASKGLSRPTSFTIFVKKSLAESLHSFR